MLRENIQILNRSNSICVCDRDAWIFTKTDRFSAGLLSKAKHSPLKKKKKIVKFLSPPLVTFS